MDSEQLKTKYRIPNTEKGIVLIVILMLVAAITIVGLGFIVRGDTELLCGQNMEMAAALSYLAESGLEQGKGFIIYPQDLAAEYWTGAAAQQLTSGTDYYDVSVAKLSELDWQITSSAYRQINSKRTAQNSITANMKLDPAVAFWTANGCRFRPSIIVNGDVYSGGNLINQGTLNGDCFADSLTGNSAAGAVKAKTALDINKPTINCSILTSNFSTQTISSSYLNSTSLNGSYYVFYKNGNLEIRDEVTINGCLAVDGDLTISGSSNTITAKKNVPAIYVSGSIILKEDSEITANGLVFVDGRIETPVLEQSTTINGSLLCDDGIRYILPDYSGNGLDGIVNGDCAGITGILDTAIVFDGNGDYIDAGNSSSFGITSQITVSAFIKTSSTSPSYQGIITKGNTSWRLQKSNSSNYVEFILSGVTTGSIISKTINLNDGNWHHIAGFYDGGSIAIYIDGVYNNGRPANGSISANTLPVYIGGNSEVSGRGFNGAIDSVRVYNTPLSAIEIATLASGGHISRNLIAFWYMNSGNCSTAVNAAPTKAAIYHWPGGSKDRWSSAAGAFYKSITRN